MGKLTSAMTRGLLARRKGTAEYDSTAGRGKDAPISQCVSKKSLSYQQQITIVAKIRKFAYILMLF
ncbi:hypothetical protein K6L44_02770 [Gluconacetobacter entanii]|uniref:hypothetical protein n=1 Tax=Gluconacetobacter entanii TaxID=108528 RepID=UPI001C9351FE|nr:hypothetical protein [Gluconacetobacter entanii]MBY4638942.1 hypothetical protein [Gluconacetobacter entanii]